MNDILILEGFSVKSLYDKKKEIKKGLSRRYTVVLTNKDGDRITLTTNNSNTKKLVIGDDLVLSITQPQTTVDLELGDPNFDDDYEDYGEPIV